MAQQDEELKGGGEKKKSPEDEARKRAQEEAQTRVAADDAQAREELVGELLVKKDEGKEGGEKSVESKERRRLLKKFGRIKVVEEMRGLEAKDELSDEDEERLTELKSMLRLELYFLMDKEGRKEEGRYLLDKVESSTLAELEDYRSDSYMGEWRDKIGNLESFFEDDCKDIPSIKVGPGGNYNRDELKKMGTSWLLRKVEAEWDVDKKEYFIIDRERAKGMFQTYIEERDRQIKALGDENQSARELLSEIK